VSAARRTRNEPKEEAEGGAFCAAFIAKKAKNKEPEA